VPSWLLSDRTLSGGNLSAIGVGTLVIGLSSYVPTYVQGVLGAGPLVAGFALAALTVGWPISVSLSGQLYLRLGFRDTALLGSALIVTGSVLCASLAPNAQVAQVAGACFLVGLGLGFVSNPTLVAVQSVFGWERRGVVTGANMFCRSIGSAIGAALFGAIANATLSDRFDHSPTALAGRLPRSADATRLVFGQHRSDQHTAVMVFIRGALYDAGHHVFIALVIVALVGTAALFLMPRRPILEPVTELRGAS
jgi:MFS family permease